MSFPLTEGLATIEGFLTKLHERLCASLYAEPYAKINNNKGKIIITNATKSFNEISKFFNIKNGGKIRLRFCDIKFLIIFAKI